MIKTDSTVVATQFDHIQQQLHDLNNAVAALKVPFWEKLLTGGFPALLGALGGGLITVLIFYLTKRKENKRHRENLQKEKDDRIGKLYGEAFGLNHHILNTVGKITFYKITTVYLNHLHNLEKETEAKKQILEFIKIQDEKYHSYLENMMYL